MDPIRSVTAVPPRLRRELLKGVVRDNVYIKAGKRPPLAVGRLWRRRLAYGLMVAAFAGVALLAVPQGRQLVPIAQAAEVVVGPPPVRTPPPPGRAAAPAPLALAATDALTLPDPRPLDGSIFPVGVRRIVLDPGHGGRDVGTETADGLYEKDIVLDIALRLRDLLRQQGVEVLLTRDRDQRVVLRDRARFANDSKADLFVSIHLNSLEPAAMHGVETFYLGPTEDPELVQLTSRENRESGYSLADVRRLLDGIYLDLRQHQSRSLAGSVQHAVFGTLAKDIPGMRDRGVKSAPFLVLVGTDMPAILAEVSCLSNQNEAALLATGEYRQSIAEALRAGIDAYTSKLGNADPEGNADVPNPKQATGSAT
ncbi:MAG TPA: N-acetylmuramoyl-L-alanine amidase [Thermoanaerobaculia bacterium]|nr:N-acetylmuramoyl-L-alanine amidase [Thermoanaerobaculia bacterium]